jgi:hypothetical protein
MPATKPEVAVRGLARLARSATTGTVSREAHLHGRERLLAAVSAPPPRAARLPRLVLAVAAATALVVALVLVRRPEPPLSYTIDGAAPGQGYVQAGPSGASARFSEGTRVSLAPGARGRIVDVGPRGARVSLEEGSAHFDVAHREGAAWLAEAGPFTVTVTGTTFDLVWSGARVEVVMYAGSVVVRGPPAPEGIVLRKGQRLVADAARAEVSRIDEPAPSGSAGASAADGSARTDPPAPGAPSSAPSAASARPRAAASWPSRVAAGDFAGVIAEAEARGLDAALDETSLADLSALADAARYAGRGDLARRALVAERTRFPGSAEARSAAFLLGRLSDDRAPATAVTWYDRYLAEAPDGSLAAEALGRKMLALRASAGRDAARPAAEAYRRRYPEGPFARAAGEILGDP